MRSNTSVNAHRVEEVNLVSGETEDGHVYVTLFIISTTSGSNEKQTSEVTLFGNQAEIAMHWLDSLTYEKTEKFGTLAHKANRAEDAAGA